MGKCGALWCIVRRRARGGVPTFSVSSEHLPPGPRVAKTNFLQIRLTPSDRTRLDQVARERHLETATFARQLLLDALERIEREAAPASPENSRAAPDTGRGEADRTSR